MRGMSEGARRFGWAGAARLIFFLAFKRAGSLYRLAEIDCSVEGVTTP